MSYAQPVMRIPAQPAPATSSARVGGNCGDKEGYASGTSAAVWVIVIIFIILIIIGIAWFFCRPCGSGGSGRGGNCGKGSGSDCN